LKPFCSGGPAPLPCAWRMQRKRKAEECTQKLFDQADEDRWRRAWLESRRRRRHSQTGEGEGQEAKDMLEANEKQFFRGTSQTGEGEGPAVVPGDIVVTYDKMSKEAEDLQCPCGGGMSCIVERRRRDDWVHEDHVLRAAGVQPREHCHSEPTPEQQATMRVWMADEYLFEDLFEAEQQQFEMLEANKKQLEAKQFEANQKLLEAKQKLLETKQKLFELLEAKQKVFEMLEANKKLLEANQKLLGANEKLLEAEQKQFEMLEANKKQLEAEQFEVNQELLEAKQKLFEKGGCTTRESDHTQMAEWYDLPNPWFVELEAKQKASTP